MRRTLTLLGLIISLLLAAAPAAAAPGNDRISLPPGFAPEGIAIGRGTTFYTGSLSLMGIWRGDLRTGEGSILVQADGRVFTGMKVDAHNRLWVAGGPAGTAYVFDADSGAQLASFAFTTEASFVNDVVVTGDAAFLTDSFRGVLYRVDLAPGGSIGQVSEIDLTTLAPAEPGVFRLNGIDATANGKTLVAVNSTDGVLYPIDAATGDAEVIDLGGESVSAGDGILLHGRTLYVVRNQLNLVAVVELAPDLRSGAVVDNITHPEFSVPTTIGRFGNALYAVNARFGIPTTEYWITRVDR
jgi:sugar lactone lactonase YvrE